MRPFGRGAMAGLLAVPVAAAAELAGLAPRPGIGRQYQPNATSCTHAASGLPYAARM